MLVWHLSRNESPPELICFFRSTFSNKTIVFIIVIRRVVAILIIVAVYNVYSALDLRHINLIVLLGALMEIIELRHASMINAIVVQQSFISLSQVRVERRIVHLLEDWGWPVEHEIIVKKLQFINTGD